MTFDMAFSRLLESEQGYVNDPNDPGGETNFGISKRAYPDVDIKNLTREQAKLIYLYDFWEPLRKLRLSSSLTFQLFDFAAHSGVKTAIRALQRALGVVDDGLFGPVSQAAERAMSEPLVIMLLLAERLDYMVGLHNWPYASRGWARRIGHNIQYAVLDIGRKES